MRVLEVAELLYITDYFVLVTTASSRQTRALADSLNQAARELGAGKGRLEGAYQSSWLLLDFGAVIVHLLTSEAREFYALDRLWEDAPHLAVEDDPESDVRSRVVG